MRYKKRKFWGFYSLDYKSMEKYIEDMAEKGWLIEKVSRFIVTFKKIDPQRIKCYIDVFPKLKNNTKDNLNEYRQFCEDSGWTYATEYDSFQFFYAPDSENPTPIQTDDEIERKIVESTLLKREITGSFIFFLMIAAYAFMGILDFKYTMLYNFTSTALFLSVPIVIVIMFIQSIYLIKIRTKIKKGISISKLTYKNAKVRRFCFSIVPVILVIFVLIGIVMDVIGLSLYGIMLSPIFIGLVVVSIFEKRLRESSRKRKIIIVTVFTLVSIFLNIFLMIYMSSNIGEITAYEVEEYPVVELKDLLDKTTTIDSNSLRDEISIFVPKNYDYWEMQRGGKSIRTKYRKAITPYFAKLIYDGMLEDLIRNEEQIDANNYWNIDEAVFIGDNDRILLRDGTVVVYIEGDFDFSDDTIIDLIMNRLEIE